MLIALLYSKVLCQSCLFFTTVQCLVLATFNQCKFSFANVFAQRHVHRCASARVGQTVMCWWPVQCGLRILSCHSQFLSPSGRGGSSHPEPPTSTSHQKSSKTIIFSTSAYQIVRPANSKQVLDQIFSQNPWSYLSCQLPIKIILIHFWISKGDQISAGGVLRFVTISDTISPFLPYLSAREFISGK